MPDDATARPRASLEIRLTAPPVVERHDPRPIAVRVTNVAGEPVWLVGVLDGSESAARYPRWLPIVAGGPWRPAERPDFTSPLGVADFRRLGPGESFDPTEPVGGARYFPIAAFGAISEEAATYEVALELDTTAADEAAWRGSLPVPRPIPPDQTERVRTLLQQVPRVRLRSNVVRLTVR